MQAFMINLDVQPDGTIPRDQWEVWEGDNAQTAILKAAQHRLMPLPLRGFFAESGDPCYDDGVPMIVHGFTVTVSFD